jgi:hypothetical protein
MILALTTNSLVDKLGIYAGIAAIPGIALLALLLFTQAREVTRLREWAAAASEREAELQSRIARQASVAPRAAAPLPGATAGQTAAGQTPRPAAPTPQRPNAVPGAPAAAPATAGAAAAGSAATAAGAATGVQAPPRPAAPTGAPSATTAPGVRPAAARTATPLRQTSSARAAGGRMDSPPPLGPMKVSSSRGLPARGIALIAVAAVALVLIVILIASHLGGSSKSPASTEAVTTPLTTSSGATAPTHHHHTTTTPTTAATVPRAGVSVAVLNGTATAGLARQVSTQVVQAGFKAGPTANAATQQVAQTQVAYSSGQRNAAAEVAKTLGVSSAEVVPIDAATRALAPAADVVVIVGADHANAH